MQFGKADFFVRPAMNPTHEPRIRMWCLVLTKRWGIAIIRHIPTKATEPTAQDE